MDEKDLTVTAGQSTQSSLGHKLVGEIRGTFFVPRYQRGYRWDTDDVQRLLDDIWACKGENYSLQPIVVKCRKKGNEEKDNEWELIDGQQRLTTLYLILYSMQQHGWKKMGAPYSVHYETRPGSATYLKTLDSSERNKNIDYFHLYQAYERIGQWFQRHGDDFAQENVANTFHSYLFKCVRVIWYEAPDNVDNNERDSIALFTRLNIGRIPLTDAELIKALLLSGVRKMQPERAQEVAAQWDGIERDLHDPDIWAFVAGADANLDAQRYPTRISLLLDTLADALAPLKPGEKRPRYRTFDTLREQITAKQTAFWNEVVELHALILGWFSSPNLYNKIGFLVATGANFGTIVQLSKAKNKSDFERLLIEAIRARMDICESGLLVLSFDKKSNHSKLLNLLLLFNVETVSRTAQRLPFRRHFGKTWSLEHIHAQNAENLTKVEQWKAWLESHRKALGTLPDQQALVHDINAALQQIDTMRDFGSTFQQLAARVIAAFSVPTPSGAVAPHHDVHSISNLALLAIRDNSALSNSVFEVKRQIVVEIDSRGDYIPLCTRNVFLKYYTVKDSQQIHFWGPQDRENYFNAIVSKLKEAGYIKAEEMQD